MTDIINEITSDPKLIKNYIEKIEDSKIWIPDNYEDELASLLKLDGMLVSKITGPENYQTLINFLTKMQACRERVVEIKRHLIALLKYWQKLQRTAVRYINITYFAKLEALRDGSRKAVVAAAILPIEEGVNEIANLAEQAELVLKHLDNTVWNIKEESGMIDEYHSLIRNLSLTKEV